MHTHLRVSMRKGEFMKKFAVVFVLTAAVAAGLSGLFFGCILADPEILIPALFTTHWLGVMIGVGLGIFIGARIYAPLKKPDVSPFSEQECTEGSGPSSCAR